MATDRPLDLVRWTFFAVLVLKFLLGAVQLLSGALLGITPPEALTGLVDALTRMELAEDPSDPLAQGLRALVPAAMSDRHFYVVYLLLHGALNAGVAVALALGHRVAYVLSIAVLGAFVLYQLWNYTQDPAPLLLVLTGIDILVILLSLAEMRGPQRPEDRT